MPDLLRRDFLCATAGIAASACLKSATRSDTQPVAAEKPPALAIIDTHTHFYDPTRPQGVPWPGKDDKLLYRRVLPHDYKSFAKPLGVTGTIVVEASSWVEDNQWVLDLAAKDPFIVGLVGHLRPGDDDFARHLKRFAANQHFRGIRIGQAMLKERVDAPGFIRDLTSLADRDLELDINGGPDLPADVARLADRLPNLRIVINHCANVKIDGKEPPAAWQRGMRSAAKHAAVF
jgi:predicted TIM-barrel fold metal-dependent hydrolase